MSKKYEAVQKLCAITRGIIHAIFASLSMILYRGARGVKNNILAPNSLKKLFNRVKMYILTEPIGLHAKIKSK